MCRSGMERKIQRLVVEDMEEWMGRVFLADRTPPMEVPLFKYLGRTLFSSNDTWSEVEKSL